MFDLVKRLREYRYFHRMQEDGSPLMIHPVICDEAADRIDRLGEELELLREYRDHHEFVMSQLAEMLNVKISAVGDLVEVFRAQQSQIGRLRDLLPDPRQMSGWDDDGCPADVAAHLIELAEVLDIDVPAHLREASQKNV